MKSRIPVKLLSLSAAALVALFVSEGYSPTAYVPTKGDRFTIGFGTTVRQSGAPVKAGDTTDPVRAVVEAQKHIEGDEKAFRESIEGAALHQAEYDLYMDFVYQYGISNWRSSSMRRHIMAGEYVEACHALLKWRYAAGYDCSTTINGQPNKRCWGVWTRQKERHQKCLAAQED